MNKVPRFVNEYFRFMERENISKWKSGFLVLEELETWKAKTERAIRSYQLGYITLKEVMNAIGSNPVDK